MVSSYHYGAAAEDLVKDKFMFTSLSATYVDSWFDYAITNIEDEKSTIANPLARIEVKSAHLFCNDCEGTKRFGRFDFTDPLNLEAQQREGVWVCFILTMPDGTRTMLGFVPASKIETKRYVQISTVGNMKPLSFEKFVEKLTRNKE